MAANSSASGAAALPDYALVPASALGPALNDRGYYVGRVERNLYWVTDGDYHSAFLATPDGVVLFDALLRPSVTTCNGRLTKSRPTRV